VLVALATTRRELVSHPRKRMRERATVAYTLRRFAGATGATIAHVLGVSVWQASALARAGERYFSENNSVTTSVRASLQGPRVEHIQQT
jgi:hypothetical protein